MRNSIVKAVGQFVIEVAGAAITFSNRQGVAATITRTGVGVFRCTFSRPLNSREYWLDVSVINPGATNLVPNYLWDASNNFVDIRIQTGAGVATDASFRGSILTGLANGGVAN